MLPSADHTPSRREFLRRSFGGSLLLAAGGLLPAGCGGYPNREGETLQVLDVKSARIVDAIADAMILETENAPLPRPSRLGIAARVDGMLAGIHPAIQDQTVLLFRVFEHATLPFGLRASRFTKLPHAEQRAYLLGWADSRLEFRRMAFQALKMFVYATYYTFDETWAHVGYDGPWVGRFEIPPFAPPLDGSTDHER